MLTEDGDGRLSVVMPCFNEAATIETITAAVLASPLVGELVIVDDCSSDQTIDLLKALDDPRVRLLRHEVNQGKGAALRTGFAAASLEFVIVQDADLEYDPVEYPIVIGPLLDGKADVVYGSRFRGGSAQRVLYFWHSVGNR
ncbi:MAG: glycosyltransferase family 2 protein, partial [Ilumatobacter sp.]|nr:glycosyltransferase family 2 protein [Ilumatobacter sp.]